MWLPLYLQRELFYDRISAGMPLPWFFLSRRSAGSLCLTTPPLSSAGYMSGAYDAGGLLGSVALGFLSDRWVCGWGGLFDGLRSGRLPVPCSPDPSLVPRST